MALEVEWVDDARRWQEHRRIWDELVERSARPSVFGTWDFLESSWLRFAEPSGDRLAVFVFRDEGRVVGYAPLRVSVMRHFAFPVRRLSALAAWNADYHAPMILPGDREQECMEAFLLSLERRDREWDYVELDSLGSQPTLAQPIRTWTLDRPGLRLLERDLSPSPYVRLEGEGLLARVGPSTRQSVRRHRRRLEASGPLELEVFEAPDNVLSGLESYLEVERRSWKKEAFIGVGKNERSVDFFRELLPRLAAKGRAAVSFLKQGGSKLAGKIDLRLGDTVWGPQWTYDAAYAEFSPGNVLLVLCLDWHAARGVRQYEMHAEELENKLRFTKDLRPNDRFRVLRLKGLRRRALFSATLLKSALVRRLDRASPKIEPSTS